MRSPPCPYYFNRKNSLSPISFPATEVPEEINQYTMKDEENCLITHLIYSSRPVDFGPKTLKDILVTSRQKNARYGLTGALICRPDLYLQYLEGPPDQIDRTYKKIVQDDRHDQIKLIKSGTSDTRLFAAWAMRDDPIKSWMWTPDEVAAGALDNLSPQEGLDVFIRHAAEVNRRF